MISAALTGLDLLATAVVVIDDTGQESSTWQEQASRTPRLQEN